VLHLHLHYDPLLRPLLLLLPTSVASWLQDHLLLLLLLLPPVLHLLLQWREAALYEQLQGQQHLLHLQLFL
jgi:hypothetical protein